MKPPSEKNARRAQRVNNGDGADAKADAAEVKKEGDESAQTNGNGSEVNSFSKELARLQFFGAGPKMAGLPSDKTTKEKTRGMKLNFEYDPVGLAQDFLISCSFMCFSYNFLFCDKIPKGPNKVISTKSR